MKHCMSAGRAFASMDLVASAVAAPGREFRITVVMAGQRIEPYTATHVDRLEAGLAAIERWGSGAVITVRPLIEQTFTEGEEAYPQPLHRDATPAAFAGWYSERSQRRVNEFQAARRAGAAA